MSNMRLRRELAALLGKNRKKIVKRWSGKIFEVKGHYKIKDIVPQKTHARGMDYFLKALICDIKSSGKIRKSDICVKQLVFNDYLSISAVQDAAEGMIILRSILMDLITLAYGEDLNKCKNLFSIVLEDIGKTILYISRIYRERDFSRLKTVITYGNKLIKVHDLNKVCRLILEAALKESDCDEGSVMLLHEDGYLHTRCSLGKKTTLPIKQKFGNSPAGNVAKTGKPLIVNKSGDSSLSTMAIIPIFADSAIIGVINLLNYSKKSFLDEEDIELLLILAHEAGAAINNCYLIAETQELYVGSIISLAAAIDMRDHYTHGHSSKVSKLAIATAKTLGLPKDIIENIKTASLLHDIGKIGIPDSILLKPGKLTAGEFNIIKKHPVYGVRILKHIPRLKVITPIIYHEHEHYGGGGYVKGLKGAHIPVESRIISIADAYEAMTSNRPYRKALSKKDAVKELKRCSGIQFDPKIVQAFLKTIRG